MTPIGLFPLPIVLLPGELVPLHIFEERYKELIAECLQRSAELGIVLHDGSGMRAIGTTAVVVDVLRRFDDGRLDILVEGRRRFRIASVDRTARSFLTAAVTPAPDDPDPGGDEDADRCVAAFEALMSVRGAAAPPMRAERPASYRVAAHLGLDTELKQELLEQTSETARLRRLTSVIEDATVRATARKRASGNGLVDHL